MHLDLSACMYCYVSACVCRLAIFEDLQCLFSIKYIGIKSLILNREPLRNPQYLPGHKYKFRPAIKVSIFRRVL